MKTTTMRGTKAIAKKALAAFSTLALTACMASFAGTQAYAANVDLGKTTTTVKNVAVGDTVTAYKIAGASVDQAKNELSYTMASGLPEAYDTIEEIAAVTTDGYSYSANSGMQSMAEALVPTLIGGTAAGTATADADGNAELSLDPGYYLLIASGTNGKTLVYQNMVVDVSPAVSGGAYVAHAAVSFDVKHTNVAADKTADSKKSVDGYGVGAKVPFSVSTAVPSYPSNSTYATFKLVDTPTTGLLIDASTVAVTGATAADYTATVSSGTLTVAFTKNFILANPGKNLTVTYKALVTSDAYSASATDVTENSVKAVYNSNPYVDGTSKTDPSIVVVKTYGVAIKKIDSNKAALPGAEFTLYDENGDPVTDENGNVMTCTSDANGYVYFDSLAAGTYTLRETKVPTGKQACADITVTLGAENCTADNPATTATENNCLDKTQSQSDWIVDPDAPVLPVTGGAGTLALTFGGIALIIAAFFVLRRNRARE